MRIAVVKWVAGSEESRIPETLQALAVANGLVGRYAERVSRLRRLVLSDRFLFITCRVHASRRELSGAELAVLAEAVDYVHMNPVKAGWVKRAEDWRWSSVRKYSGSVYEKGTRHPVSPIDRALLSSDERTRI